MAKLDTYYRAFKEYRKETKNNADCKKERKILSESNVDSDVLTSTKFLCTIEKDWVEAIEEGMEFVEKALAEERQFIRVNGEIVPIEKVKKVSKTSVEYLARHANMITHLPEKEGDTIVPDELYITEKLNDYAVYENRFLYMLLRYLDDFICFRIDKIEQLRQTYIGNFSVNKEIKTPKRTLTYETKIYEKREDNPYPIADAETNKMLQRIKDLQSIVSAMLSTPLMTEVGKSPLLKPPITKTNVLKMNNNFKRALALYEYISGYNTPGYKFEEVTKEYTPFSDMYSDEIADSISLTSFLTYKIGNDIESILETGFNEEERKRREEKEKKLEDRVRRLKKRALESNKTLEEYMLVLETRNQQLLKDAEELSMARNEIEKLNREIDELNLEKLELNRRIEELNGVIEEKIKEIQRLNQKYIDDMAALKREHEKEIDELNRAHDLEIANLESEHEIEIGNLNNAHDSQIRALEEDHRLNVQNLNDKYLKEIEDNDNKYQTERTAIINKYESSITSLNTSHKAEIDKLKGELDNVTLNLENVTTNRKQKIKEFEDQIKTLNKNFDDMVNGKNDEIKALENKNSDLVDTINFHKGELDAMRVKEGMLVPCDDFSSKERFMELTKEFEAMEKFMSDQWKLTKKRIKREVKEEQEKLEEEAKRKEEAIIKEFEEQKQNKNKKSEDSNALNEENTVDVKVNSDDEETFDDFMTTEVNEEEKEHQEEVVDQETNDNDISFDLDEVNEKEEVEDAESFNFDDYNENEEFSKEEVEDEE